MSINEEVRELCVFIFLKHTEEGKEREVCIEDNEQERFSPNRQ
jgi:hypothetical protein